MQIEPYQPRHLHELALQPHQQHLGVALRAHGWAEQVADAGPCWTALVDGEPIACAGFQECWEGRAIACEPRGRGLLRPHFLSYAAPVAGHMIAQERLPSLARPRPVLGHVLGDGRLCDLDPELQQLAMNTRRAPQ